MSVVWYPNEGHPVDITYAVTWIGRPVEVLEDGPDHMESPCSTVRIGLPGAVAYLTMDLHLADYWDLLITEPVKAFLTSGSGILTRTHHMGLTTMMASVTRIDLDARSRVVTVRVERGALDYTREPASLMPEALRIEEPTFAFIEWRTQP